MQGFLWSKITPWRWRQKCPNVHQKRWRIRFSIRMLNLKSLSLILWQRWLFKVNLCTLVSSRFESKTAYQMSLHQMAPRWCSSKNPVLNSFAVLGSTNSYLHANFQQSVRIFFLRYRVNKVESQPNLYGYNVNTRFNSSRRQIRWSEIEVIAR